MNKCDYDGIVPFVLVCIAGVIAVITLILEVRKLLT